MNHNHVIAPRCQSNQQYRITGHMAFYLDLRLGRPKAESRLFRRIQSIAQQVVGMNRSLAKVYSSHQGVGEAHVALRLANDALLAFRRGDYAKLLGFSDIDSQPFAAYVKKVVKSKLLKEAERKQVLSWVELPVDVECLPYDDCGEAGDDDCASRMHGAAERLTPAKRAIFDAIVDPENWDTKKKDLAGILGMSEGTFYKAVNDMKASLRKQCAA